MTGREEDQSKSMERFTFQTLTSERWEDFEALFGKRGAIGGCWCMWWRLKRAEFTSQQGDKNKAAMKKIVDSGEVPGILVYDGDRAVGWCSVAPREAYPVLDRSPVLKRVDDQPVWSIVCFFIAKPYRQKGMSSRLIKAALDYAHLHGARIVEGYPIEPKKKEAPDIYAFTGLTSVFEKAGFVEIIRRSEFRPIMRFYFNVPGSR